MAAGALPFAALAHAGCAKRAGEIDASGGEQARRAEIELPSGAGFDEARVSRLAAIRANGWQVTGTKEEKDEIGWKLAKGASVAEMEPDSGFQPGRGQARARGT